MIARNAKVIARAKLQTNEAPRTHAPSTLLATPSASSCAFFILRLPRAGRISIQLPEMQAVLLHVCSREVISVHVGQLMTSSTKPSIPP